MIETFMRWLATLAGIWMALAAAGFTAKLAWLALMMGWGLL
jgi:hypothetical protein